MYFNFCVKENYTRIRPEFLSNVRNNKISFVQDIMMKSEDFSLVALIPRAYHDVYKILICKFQEDSDKVEDLFHNLIKYLQDYT